jgi:tetratricopeptide (TPR) repeat protein
VSSEAVYEQYKDALKRGHVASLRGRLEDALLAYAEASTIAPERATPHTSAGTALLRRGRPAEALAHYEVALSIAPRDEAALLGRAQALADLDRRGEAADVFDSLAEIHGGAGHLADAVDAARRGLELAEGRERRRTLEQLIARLRSSHPGEPGRAALERALQVLEGPALLGSKRQRPALAGSKSADQSMSAPAPAAAPDADHEAPPAGLASSQAAAANEPTPDSDGTGVTSAPPASAPFSRKIPDSATAAELATRAEEAVAAAVPQPAVDALLDLATLHARDGRVDAALDACYAAVSFDPGNVALHLALVELYDGRGWEALAGEKVSLLERLARLDGDERALAAIDGVRASRA